MLTTYHYCTMAYGPVAAMLSLQPFTITLPVLGRSLPIDKRK